MKSLHTLKLNATAIGATAPRQSRVAEPAAAIDALPAVPAPAAPATSTKTRMPRTVTSSKHLFALLALDAIATLAAVEATGAVHGKGIRIATVLVVGAVAAAILAGVAIAFKGERAAEQTAAAPAAKRGFSTTKAILMLMMAAGIAAYFGGAGTWAGFTAETTNPNDALASGTLTFNNTVDTNTACESVNGASANNVNSGCDAAFALTNLEPGVFGGTSQITLQNTGSLDASKLYLWAPYANGVLHGPTINSGDTVNSLPLTTNNGPNGLEGTIAAGDDVVVTYGGHSQTFVVDAGGASPGATSIPIVNDITYPNVAAYTFQAGATIQDASSDTTVDNTNCYDIQTTSSPVAGAYNGTQLNNINPTTHNPMCQTALLSIQEIGTNHNYCWWGNGAGSASGMCTMPISAAPSISSNTTIAAGTYTVSALRGNVVNGDTLAFTEGPNQVTCPATADARIADTSITVGACTVVTGANGLFDGSALVTDQTTLTTLASDTTDTLSNFDISTKYSNKVELTPVSANGTTAATGVDLPHYDSGVTDTRTFYVGVFVPGPATVQNQLQGLQSTFGLTWHVDQ